MSTIKILINGKEVGEVENLLDTEIKTTRFYGEGWEPIKEKIIMLSCSFCGKGSKEVIKLIVGPAVYICDECVGLCVQIIDEEKGVNFCKRKKIKK